MSERAKEKGGEKATMCGIIAGKGVSCSETCYRCNNVSIRVEDLRDKGRALLGDQVDCSLGAVTTAFQRGWFAEEAGSGNEITLIGRELSSHSYLRLPLLERTHPRVLLGSDCLKFPTLAKSEWGPTPGVQDDPGRRMCFE